MTAQDEARLYLDQAIIRFAPDRRTMVCDVTVRREGGALVVSGEVHSKDLRDRLLSFLRDSLQLDVRDSVECLPQASLGAETCGIVNVSVANMRAAPSNQAELVAQALLGTPLKVLKRKADTGPGSDWYYVQTPDDYLGWMERGFVRMNAAQSEAWTASPKVIVVANSSVTRRIPSARRRTPPGVVSDVVAGCLLRLRRATPQLYEVEYPDGRAALIRRSEARPFTAWLADAKPTSEGLLHTAEGLFGVPYLWGGTSSKGVDCSGFTKVVFFMHGVLLPRDASQQVTVGEAVDVGGGFGNLRKGDLLFFGFKATAGAKERVTHVGISLGGARFIHASGDVRVNSLDPADPDFDAFRRDTFLAARRIVGAGPESGVRRLATLPSYGASAR